MDLIEPLDANSDILDTCLPLIADIHRYWDNKRNGKAMPRRCDIDPIDFPKNLPGILLIDIVESAFSPRGVFRYRVVGTREVDNRKHNPTGKFVEDGYFFHNLEGAFRSYLSVQLQKRPIYEMFSFLSEEGLPIEEQSIMLPLSEDDEHVSQILVYSESCLVAEDDRP